MQIITRLGNDTCLATAKVNKKALLQETELFITVMFWKHSCTTITISLSIFKSSKDFTEHTISWNRMCLIQYQIYLSIIRNAWSRNGQILNQILLLKGRYFNTEGSAYVLNVLISQDINRNSDSYMKMSLTISTSLALQSLTALCNVFNTEIKYSSDKTIKRWLCFCKIK